MPDLYLIAHVVNAQSEETAEVEFEVATRIGDEYYSNDGFRIWPFWMRPLGQPYLTIPEGWLDHLAEEAIHYAADHRTQDRLDALLGLDAAPTPTYGTFKRRF